MALVDDILLKLPKLSAGDLYKVLSHARALRTYSGATEVKEPTLVHVHDYLLDGLREALRKRNLRVNFSTETLERMKAYKQFTGAAPAIAEWFDTLVPNMDRTSRLALSAIAAEALVLYVESFRTWPLGLQTLMYGYHLVPQAFERAFPGYAAQGWTPMLVAQLGGGVCSDRQGPNRG